MSATDADGFTHTIHLDCGCWMRLNYSGGGRADQPGDWHSCPSWPSHSGVYDYDQRTGEPNMDRDRQVVRVVEEDAPPEQRVVSLVSNHWTAKKVSDLVVGDDVREYGRVSGFGLTIGGLRQIYGGEAGITIRMPLHATVEVRDDRRS